MKRRITLILTLVLTAAACGGAEISGDATTSDPTSQDPTTTTIDPTTIDPDALVLEVREEGGLLPVNAAINPMPRFILYADGRLLFPAPVPAIHPGPLVRSYGVTQLSGAQIDAVRNAIEATGLSGMTDERFRAADNVADAPDTVFTYIDTTSHRAAVYALGISDPQDPAVPPFAELFDLLHEFATTATDATTLDPAGYQVIVTPTFGVETDELAVIEPWPLSTPSAEIPQMQVSSELRCIVLSGDEAEAVGSVLAAAHQMTFFEDGDTTYRFTVRPLAAHEEGCP